jgi:hypothetical protein
MVLGTPEAYQAKPCGNCRHPECSDCYPRAIISNIRPETKGVFDPNNNEWAHRKELGLTAKRFYGKLTLMFEDGKIMRGEILESIKP